MFNIGLTISLPISGETYFSSGSFTILGLWVLGLAVSHINESNCKLMSPEHFF